MDVTSCVHLHTLLHVVVQSFKLKATFKRTQQLPTMLLPFAQGLRIQQSFAVCHNLFGVFFFTNYSLSSWRFLECFFWSSQSKSFSRAKAEPRSKQKTMGEEQWGLFSLPSPLAPSPPPPLFSFSSAVQLSRGWISYFTIHTRKNTPRKRQQWG